MLRRQDRGGKGKAGRAPPSPPHKQPPNPFKPPFWVARRAGLVSIKTSHTRRFSRLPEQPLSRTLSPKIKNKSKAVERPQILPTAVRLRCCRPPRTTMDKLGGKRWMAGARFTASTGVEAPTIRPCKSLQVSSAQQKICFHSQQAFQTFGVMD